MLASGGLSVLPLSGKAGLPLYFQYHKRARTAGQPNLNDFRSNQFKESIKLNQEHRWTPIRHNRNLSYENPKNTKTDYRDAPIV